MITTIDRQILTCIDALYNAAVDQRKLEPALGTISKSLDADGCHLVHHDRRNPLLDISILYSEGPILWNETLAKKFQGLIFDDPRIILANRFPEKPISCRAYLTDKELHASRVYQEVLRFSKAEYTLGVNLPGSNDDVVTGLALFRSPGRQPFDQKSCDFLGELVPHIKRLFVIQKRLIMLDMGHRMTVDALDHIPMGIFIVNDQLQIRFANASAKELFYNAEGFRAGSSRLMVYNPNEYADLQHLVVHATQTSPNQPTQHPRTICLTGEGQDVTLTAMVSSLSLANLPLQAGALEQSLAVIFVTDPRKPQEAPPDLLRRMFGLTRKEAEIVEQLVIGRSLQKAAEFLGMAENTARTHIKAVFSKTNTSQQADVVRLVLSSPVWIQKTSSKRVSGTPFDPLSQSPQRHKILGILPPKQTFTGKN
ncbi:MAG: hypothetical protein HW380_3178 [Magnetococcales bacterium]|nr:hypothetical protein [Magnetococcales bacterium]HIJ83479.1 PAS domain-containing protein [Magnetococcales bacterium]